ncbi:hypothetical protein AgCh_031920 [Apium graveolens]
MFENYEDMEIDIENFECMERMDLEMEIVDLDLDLDLKMNMEIEHLGDRKVSSGTPFLFAPTANSVDKSFVVALGSKDDLEALFIGIGESDDNDGNSCKYQTCNVSYFNISDMIFSEIPIKGHLSDFNETASFPDYKCDELSVVLDEEVVIMPFLEDSFESSNSHNSRLSEDTTIDSVDSSLCASIHHLKSYGQESDGNTHQNWDQADFLDLDLFIRTLRYVSNAAANSWSPANEMLNTTRKKESTTLTIDMLAQFDGECKKVK